MRIRFLHPAVLALAVLNVAFCGAVRSQILGQKLSITAHALPLAAEERDPGKLTLNRIFIEKEFEAEEFGPAVWLKDGAGYTVLEPEAGRVIDENRRLPQSIVHYDTESGERQLLVPSRHLTPPGQSLPLRIENYEWSADGRRLLAFANPKKDWRLGQIGDCWVLDKSLWMWQKLGGEVPSQSLQACQFSPDGRYVGYVRDNNLFVEELTSPFKIHQLTWDGSRTIFNGKAKGCNNSMLNTWYPNLMRKGRDGFSWSSDSKSIAFVQLDMEGVPDFQMIDDTDSLYPKIISFPYTKVGGMNPAFRVGVVDLDASEPRWLKLPADPHDDYLWEMQWTGKPNEVELQVLNRLQNTMRVLLVDTRAGEVRTILTESDAAWIEPNNIHWLEAGQKFTWLSERESWQHLYLYSRDGQVIRSLTPGNFDVMAILGFDEKDGWLYYIGSPDNPTQRYLYRVRLDGHGGPERVTPPDQSGTHLYQLSPDFKWAFDTHSTFDTPPITDLIRLPKHEVVRTLVDNAKLREKLKAVRKRPTEFFRVDIGDAVKLDGWMIKPPDFDANKSYPLLFFVYGEPALQTVLDQWGGNAVLPIRFGGNQYLWHLMLAQQGYLVVSIDNRGTPSLRGRAWRKIIYRQLGILAPKEQAAAAQAIIKQWSFIDPSRVGVYGHSGGGQMSLNLIFRYPDLYRVAMPSSFVSNQLFYHPGYQERFMGLPSDNLQGYRDGSPITWANRLQGDLLIIHGSGDSNVHYQTFEALVNELVADRKYFSMMVYPNREHCLCEPEDTQYHLWDLRTRYLEEHIPPGSRPLRASDQANPRPD